MRAYTSSCASSCGTSGPRAAAHAAVRFCDRFATTQSAVARMESPVGDLSAEKAAALPPARKARIVLQNRGVETKVEASSGEQ